MGQVLHWVLGVLFMLHLSVIVAVLREVLRPEVHAQAHTHAHAHAHTHTHTHTHPSRACGCACVRGMYRGPCTS